MPASTEELLHLHQRVAGSAVTRLLEKEGSTALSTPAISRVLTILALDIITLKVGDTVPSPASLFEFSRDFHAAMVGAVEHNGGFVAHLAGDSILAVWGLERAAEPGRACASALECLSHAERLDDWRGSGLRFSVGVGLHESECLAGLVGTSERSVFVVQGAGISLAHRLVRANLEFGSRAIATDAVRSRAGGLST